MFDYVSDTNLLACSKGKSLFIKEVFALLKFTKLNYLEVVPI